MIPAGKAEFFAVSIVLNIVLLYVAFAHFQLKIMFAEQQIGYAVHKLPIMAFVFFGYAGLTIINCLRRIKELSVTPVLSFVAVVPVVGQFTQLLLANMEPENKATITPNGGDPYDPNSWMPGSKKSKKGSGAPAVKFRGEALMLPGEDHWDDAA